MNNNVNTTILAGVIGLDIANPNIHGCNMLGFLTSAPTYIASSYAP